MSQNWGHQRAYCHPQVRCVRGEPWWWLWCLGKNPDSSTRALWQSYLQRHLGASRRNGGSSENFAYQYRRYVNGSLTCLKIVRLGAYGFISHPNGGVLRTFIAVKHQSPRPDMKQQSLGPVASTLTTTPPRRQDWRNFGPQNGGNVDVRPKGCTAWNEEVMGDYWKGTDRRRRFWLNSGSYTRNFI
jgi:hypothetical protein